MDEEMRQEGFDDLDEDMDMCGDCGSCSSCGDSCAECSTEGGYHLTKENFPTVKDTLLTLIQMLTAHAYIFLGLIPLPGSEEILFDLKQAKQSIDLTAVLVDHAKNMVTENEFKELENVVSQLRMNYLEKSAQA